MDADILRRHVFDLNQLLEKEGKADVGTVTQGLKASTGGLKEHKSCPILFDSTNPPDLLHFLKRTLDAEIIEDSVLRDARAKLLEFIADFIKPCSKTTLSSYLSEICQTCVRVYQRDTYNTVKAVALKCYLRALKKINQLKETQKRLSSFASTWQQVREHGKFFESEARFNSKISQTTRGTLFKILGLQITVFPEDFDEDSARSIIQQMHTTLHKQFKQARKPELFVITGCFKCLTRALSHPLFVGQLSQHRHFDSELFDFLRTTIRTAAERNLSRYAVAKAALGLLASHSQVFRNGIAEDPLDIAELVRSCCLSDARVLRKNAFMAYEAMLDQISILLDERSEDAQSLRTFNHLVRKSLEVFQDPSVSAGEEDLAVKTLGALSRTMKRFMKTDDILHIARTLFNRCDLLAAVDVAVLDPKEGIREAPELQRSNRDIRKLAITIQSFSRIVMQLDTLDLFVSDERAFSQMSEKMLKYYWLIGESDQYSVARALLLWLAAASKQPELFQSTMDGIVDQALAMTLETASTSAMELVSIFDPDTGMPDDRLLFEYEKLWVSLLLSESFIRRTAASAGCDIEEISKIQSTLMDSLLSRSLLFLEQLDLDYFSKEEASTAGSYLTNLEPQFPVDHELFQNFCTFFLRLFRSTTAFSRLKKWIPVFCLSMMERARKWPLVSGYYKLLARTMQAAESQSYFCSSTTSEIGGPTEAMDMGDETVGKGGQLVAPRSLLSEIYIPLGESPEQVLALSLQSFARDTVQKTEQYGEELLISSLDLLLHLPTPIHTEETLVPSLTRGLEVGLAHTPTASAALSCLQRCYGEPSIDLSPFIASLVGQLSKYLDINTAAGKVAADNVASFSASHSMSGGRMQFIDGALSTSSSSVSRSTLQVEMLRFVGRLGADGRLLLGSMEKALEASVVWDPIEPISLSFKVSGEQTELCLGLLLPRLHSLVNDEQSRPRRIASAELLHTIISVVIGKTVSSTTTRLGGRVAADFTLYWPKIFPVLLVLAVDNDSVVRKLFSSLLLQIVHWLIEEEGRERDQACLLDALGEGISKNGSVREMSARCFAEFFSFSSAAGRKRGGKGKGGLSQSKPEIVNILLDRLVSLTLHPSPSMRVGAALTFNTIFPYFKEDITLVSRSGLLLLQSFLLSIKLSDRQEDVQTSLQPAMDSVALLERVIVDLKDVLSDDDEERKGEIKNLREMRSWLFAQISKPEGLFRKKCFHLFSFLPFSTSSGDALGWIDDFVQQNGTEGLARILDGGERHAVLRCKAAGNLDGKATEEGLQQLISSLESYRWLFSQFPRSSTATTKLRFDLADLFRHRSQAKRDRESGTIIGGNLKDEPNLVKSLKRFFELFLESFALPANSGFSEGQDEELKVGESGIEQKPSSWEVSTDERIETRPRKKMRNLLRRTMEKVNQFVCVLIATKESVLWDYLSKEGVIGSSLLRSIVASWFSDPSLLPESARDKDQAATSYLLVHTFLNEDKFVLQSLKQELTVSAGNATRHHMSVSEMFTEKTSQLKGNDQKIISLLSPSLLCLLNGFVHLERVGLLARAIKEERLEDMCESLVNDLLDLVFLENLPCGSPEDKLVIAFVLSSMVALLPTLKHDGIVDRLLTSSPLPPAFLYCPMEFGLVLATNGIWRKLCVRILAAMEYASSRELSRFSSLLRQCVLAAGRHWKLVNEREGGRGKGKDAVRTAALPFLKDFATLLEGIVGGKPFKTIREFRISTIVMVESLLRAGVTEHMTSNVLPVVSELFSSLLSSESSSYLLKGRILRACGSILSPGTVAQPASIHQSIRSLVLESFPLRSTDSLSIEDSQRFKLLFLNILSAAALAGNVAILESLAHNLSEKPHRFERQVQAGLRKLVAALLRLDLEEGTSLASINTLQDAVVWCLEQCLASHRSVVFRRRVLGSLLVPLLEGSRLQTVEKFLCSSIPISASTFSSSRPLISSLMSTIAAPLPPADSSDRESKLFEGEVAFTIVSIAYRVLEPHTIKSSLTQAYLGGQRECKGTELTAAVFKLARGAITISALSSASSDLREAAVSYAQAAFAALSTAVAATQTKAKWYDLIFEEKEGGTFWENVLLEEEWDKRLSANTKPFEVAKLPPLVSSSVKSTSATRSLSRSNRGAGELAFLSALPYVADEDDAEGGKHGKIEYVTGVAGDSIVLEMDDINCVPFMQVVVRLLDHMERHFTPEWATMGMPVWMRALAERLSFRNSFSSLSSSSPHVQTFLLRLILNKPKPFLLFSKSWLPLLTEAFLRVEEPYGTDRGFHYLLRDLCELVIIMARRIRSEIEESNVGGRGEAGDEVAFDVGEGTRFLDHIAQVLPNSSSLIFVDNLRLFNAVLRVFPKTESLNAGRVKRELRRSIEHGGDEEIPPNTPAFLESLLLVQRSDRKVLNIVGVPDDLHEGWRLLNDLVSSTNYGISAKAAEVLGSLAAETEKAGEQRVISHVKELLRRIISLRREKLLVMILDKISVSCPQALEKEMILPVLNQVPSLVGDPKLLPSALRVLLHGSKAGMGPQELFITLQPSILRLLSQPDDQSVLCFLRLLTELASELQDVQIERLFSSDYQSTFLTLSAHQEEALRLQSCRLFVAAMQSLKPYEAKERGTNHGALAATSLARSEVGKFLGKLLLQRLVDEGDEVRTLAQEFWDEKAGLPSSPSQRLLAIAQLVDDVESLVSLSSQMILSFCASSKENEEVLFSTLKDQTSDVSDLTFEGEPSTYFAAPLFSQRRVANSLRKAGGHSGEISQVPFFSSYVSQVVGVGLASQTGDGSQAVGYEAGFGRHQLFTQSSSFSEGKGDLSFSSQETVHAIRSRRFAPLFSDSSSSRGQQAQFFKDRYQKLKKQSSAERKRERFVHARSVSLLRTYKSGSFPDVRIKAVDVLRVLHRVCGADLQIARITFLQLFDSLLRRSLVNSPSSNATTFWFDQDQMQLFTKVLQDPTSSAFASSVVFSCCSLAAVGCQDMGVENSLLTSIQPSLIGLSAGSSLNHLAGIHFLEQLVRWQKERSRSEREAGKHKASQQTEVREAAHRCDKDDATTYWAQLLALYHSIGEEEEIVDTLSSQPLGQIGEVYSLLYGRQRKITDSRSIIDTLQEWVERETASHLEEKEVLLLRRAEYLSREMRWHEVASISSDYLFQFHSPPCSLVSEKMMSLFLLSSIKCTTRGYNYTEKTEEFLRAAMGERKVMTVLEEKLPHALAFCFLKLGDFHRCRDSVSKFYRSFLRDWSSLSPLSREMKLRKLHLLHCVSEVDSTCVSLASESPDQFTRRTKYVMDIWKENKDCVDAQRVDAWSDFVFVRESGLRALLARGEELKLDISQSSLLDYAQVTHPMLYLRSARAAITLNELDVSLQYMKEYRDAAKALSEQEGNKKREQDIFRYRVILDYRFQCCERESILRLSKPDHGDAKLKKHLEAALKVAESGDFQSLKNGEDPRGVAEILRLEAEVHERTLLLLLHEASASPHHGRKKDKAAQLEKHAGKSFSLFKQAISFAEQTIGKKNEGGHHLGPLYLQYALFCSRLLEEKERAEKADDDTDVFMNDTMTGTSTTSRCLNNETVEAVARTAIESILKAMAEGHNEATLSFPRALRLLPLLSTSDTSSVFADRVQDVPPAAMVNWVPQLCAMLNSTESPSDSSSGSTAELSAAVAALEVIADQFPQAIYYDFRMVSDSIPPQNIGAVARLRFLIRNSALDLFVASLRQLYSPELRLWDNLREMDRALSDKNSARALAVYHTLLEDCFGGLPERRRAKDVSPSSTTFALTHVAPGPYEVQFFRQYSSKIVQLFGKDGAHITKETVRKALQVAEKARDAMSRTLHRGEEDMSQLSEWLSLFDPTEMHVEIPGHYGKMERNAPKSGERSTIPSIVHFDRRVTVLKSKQAPRRIAILASDGKRYRFLVKGGEDLRLDQRILQMFRVMAEIIESSGAGGGWTSLAMKVYKVIPMTSGIGLIEWLENTSTMKQVLDEELLLYETGEKEKGYSTRTLVQLQEKYGSRLNSSALLFSDKRPDDIVRFFSSLEAAVPVDLFRRRFLRLSPSAETFLSLRSVYFRSVAMIAIFGYILGIGDRHLENFLLDSQSGRLTSIDFGCSFGSGLRLRVPELLPFRLTKQMLGVLDPLDGQQLIERTMTNVLTALQEKKDHLLSILEIFVKDPLMAWEQDLTKQRGKQGKEATGTSRGSVAWKKVKIVRDKLHKRSPVSIMQQELGDNTQLSNQELKLAREILQQHQSARQKVCETSEAQVQCLMRMATDPNILGRQWTGLQLWL